MKIPYMLVVGEREENDGTISVRKHGDGDLGPRKLDEFAKFIQDAVDNELGVIA